VSCPKSLCCQKTHFGPLGVKELSQAKRMLLMLTSMAHSFKILEAKFVW